MRFILSLLTVISMSFIITGCGVNLGRASGKIEVHSLPDPEKPSKVKGIGTAMEEEKPVLIYRTTWKTSPLPDDKRNLFFISKLMNSYSPSVKVVEFGNSVSYNSSDYYNKFRDYLPVDGFAVIKKEYDNWKIYSYEIDYKESYEELVEPMEMKLTEVLGPSTYNYRSLIRTSSVYPEYNKAMGEGKSMIMVCFENTCNSFKPSEKKDILNNILPSFSDEAECFEIKTKNFTDPANELYSRQRNILNVYNHHTRKVYPALLTDQDIRKNIRRYLDER